VLWRGGAEPRGRWWGFTSFEEVIEAQIAVSCHCFNDLLLELNADQLRQALGTLQWPKLSWGPERLKQNRGPSANQTMDTLNPESVSAVSRQVPFEE